MAPTLYSRMALVARASTVSPGAIAGAVVGSVIGGTLLVVILGFIFFRHRRRIRETQTGDAQAQPIQKASFSGRFTSLPWQGVQPGQTTTSQAVSPPNLKEGRPDGTDLVPPHVIPPSQPITQPSGEDWTRHDEGLYTYRPSDQDILPRDVDFSMSPRQTTFPLTTIHDTNQPLNHAATAPAAANSTYYDMRISMESEPDHSLGPPSRQMTELYQAQLRDAEEHRRRSGSLPRRIWNNIKRKSTRSSAHGTVDSQSAPTQQYFTTGPPEDPAGIKQEPDLEVSKDVDWQSIPAANRMFEEPEEISEDTDDPSAGPTRSPRTGSGPAQRQQSSVYREDSQLGRFPFRIDSGIRETTEKDPELPSSALRRTDSTHGLPPVAQPHPAPEARTNTRLKSPGIPEPMDLDDPLPGASGIPAFNGSHSPPLPSESIFVPPQLVMPPSNPVEKAAYTDYQMKNSSSPPPVSISPPARFTEQPSPEQIDDADPVDQDDFEQYLDLPDDDEPRLSSDSYEYPITPGQSSTVDGTNGQTPATVATSPSPFPTMPEQSVKAESSMGSMSPEVSRLSTSPPSSSLICPGCGQTFDQIHKLNHHKRYHDRKHECHYEGCDKKFGTRTHLDRHINDKHLKSKAYHCREPSCPYFKGGKSFPRKDNWRRHMMKQHGKTSNDLDAMDQSFG